MTLKKTIAVLTAAALAVGMAACSSGSGGSGGDGNYIVVNSTEPQHPLLPGDTNENGGGRIIDMINSGLMYYDAEGKAKKDLAESIELEGEKTYRITLKDGMSFSDGTPIKADNFVKAWNYVVEHDQLGSSYFESIQGYESGKPMEGLKVVDDKTFTVELNQPEADFPNRLGYTAFFPLPDSAFDDMDAYGEKPVSSGPYKLQEWSHNESATIVPNDSYKGDRKAQNEGVKFVFYPQLDPAYADLLAGQLDVLDTVPDSAMTSFQQELGDRAVNKSVAYFQSFTIPQKLEHFSGEEGKLRRQAISLAINREEVTEKIFNKTRVPAKDFTAPVVEGYSADIAGNDVLAYNPEKAKELWAKADEMSPFTGEFSIAYNADGGHQGWVDAVTNSIKNTLGIEAVGNPYPDFKSLRDDITNRTISGAFRSGWQGDYPGLGNFLVPLYGTGGSSNDGDYSNPDFDAKLKEAAGAKTSEESNTLYNQSQETLFKDLPAIPLWYSNATGGYSENVSNVEFGWNSTPLYYKITRK